jgi:hypothetical protein
LVVTGILTKIESANWLDVIYEYEANGSRW